MDKAQKDKGKVLKDLHSAEGIFGTGGLYDRVLATERIRGSGGDSLLPAGSLYPDRKGRVLSRRAPEPVSFASHSCR